MGPDAFGMNLQLFVHEIYHAITRKCGDVRNRIRNSTMVLVEILFKPNDEETNVDAIIQLELANLILHKKSKNLQEALAAYGIHLYQQNPLPPITEEDIKKAGSKKDVTTANLDLNILRKDAEAVKNTILANSDVKKIFNDFLWLSGAFGDNLMPLSVTQFSLDIRYDLHPRLIIANDPTTDVEWRFNMVVDSLRNLEKKGMLNLVPRFSPDSKSSNLRQKEEIRFEYFLGQITGLEAGIIDLMTNGVDEHIQKLQFTPSDNIINTNSMYKPIDLTLVTGNEAMKYMFALNENSIWTGFRMKEEISISPNTRFVPDEILTHWFENFRYWILKECVIQDYDIDEKIDMIPQLDKLKNSETCKRAKLMQESLGLEKAVDYDLYNKMRNEK